MIWISITTHIFPLRTGLTDRDKIRKNVLDAIDGNFTLYCLGFGYDLDYGFLDAMAKQNDGVARRIYEASDSVVQLQVNFRETLKEIFVTCHQ